MSVLANLALIAVCLVAIWLADQWVEAIFRHLREKKGKP